MDNNNSAKLSTLSQTLFIPLSVRANETASPSAVIKDQKAVEIMGKANTTDIITDGGSISTLGILARTTVIDSEIQKLLSGAPNAIIINLGAGLDTRISRLDNGSLRWYDLDFPEVITLRRQYFSENERIKFIEKSALDSSWTKDISYTQDDIVIIIAEGLLMYFTEAEVQQLLELLTTHFSEAHLFFDVVHSFFVNKKISSTFHWGLDKACDIEKLNSKVKLIQSWSTGDFFKKRQPIMLRLFNFLPSTRNRSQILHLQLRQFASL